MKESNERYGVVNEKERSEYEKLYQLPMGYEYTTFDREEAIRYCRSLKKNPFYSNYIVERIYNTEFATNLKEEIFRGGDEKDN